MDQYLSTVIIAAITGVFSIVTLLIQKKQDKVINKIDEQTAFIEKEKTLKQARVKKLEERESLIHAIMILILDTNLYILKNTEVGGDKKKLHDDVFKKSEELEAKFAQTGEELKAIDKEYELLINLATEVFNKKPEVAAEASK